MRSKAETSIRIHQSSGSIDKKGLSALDIAINRTAFRKRFKRNEEIYGAKELADYFYKVIVGCVRSYTVVEDGRRLIAAFYLPGEIFGLEPTERHLCSAEAVTDAETLVVNRNEVMQFAMQENAVARDLWAHVANELHRTQSHLLLLNKSASERLANFLLEMSERRGLGNEVGLPMCRQDIADYLALTSETVSRTLAKLENSAAIALRTTRQIILRDRAGLEQMLT